MKKIFRLFIFLFVVAPLIGRAQKPAVVVNDKPGWHRITETTVDFEKETDEVDVLLSDQFSALRFKVLDAPIELMNMDVYFEDGTKKQITIGHHLKAAGESSPDIQLDSGKEKNIERIVLRYKTVKQVNSKKAHLEIWGKKTGQNESKKAADKKEEKKSEKAENKSGH
jgi:hypothetical protein